MTTAKKAFRIALVVASIGAGTVVAVEPAAAHSGSWSKSRSGCLYTGGVDSFHSYAYTRKNYGGCAGHAWLQVQYTNGTWSAQEHAEGGVEIYGSIWHAYHKSQSGEGWGQSH